jgi:hypothetical protein
MDLLEKDKRKFNVIIGSKKCGVCSGASPSGAARKVNGKRSEFYLKETTKGSKKKLYGPYSSKKKVIQRGGEEKTLREHICDTVLQILKNCDKLHTFDSEMNRINDKYKILENAYLFLGINQRQDKFTVLKDIIRMRDNYFTEDGKEFPLCYCLCSLNENDDRKVETLFCFERGPLVNKRLSKNDYFYQNNWSKLIKFLRITIRQIELEILEQNKKNTERLTGIRNQLNKEENKRFANLRREIEESRALHAAQEAGPAEEQPYNNLNMMPPKNPQSYLLNNRELAELGINPNGSSAANPPTNISKIPRSMLQPVGRPRRNVKPTQPPHNNQKPPNMSNLEARLAALKND